MNEIMPDFYRLELPLPNNPLGFVSAFLVRGDDGHLLIDTGWDNEESLGSLKKQLDEIGVRVEDISQIVGTHTHPDHYGLAGRLRELSQAQIALHYLEKELVIPSYSDISKLIQRGVERAYLNGVPADMVSQVLSEFRAKQPEMIEFTPPTLPDTTLRGGETISAGSFSFSVLWTPGHSPGHICLFEATREILITGDHVLPDTTTAISMDSDSSPNPLGDYFKSLDEMKKLKVSLILPGHGQPFTSLGKRIEEIIQNHRQRGSEILETIKVEAKTAYQISTEITWMSNTTAVSFQDLGPWQKTLVLDKTLAYLELMSSEGVVQKSSRGGTIFYQAA